MCHIFKAVMKINLINVTEISLIFTFVAGLHWVGKLNFFFIIIELLVKSLYNQGGHYINIY